MTDQRFTSAPNPFGRGIPLRNGRPIQLARYEKNDSDEHGRIYVVPEAVRLIQQITEPVAVISVVGSYRRGKSWFANVLHGRHDGFELGAKTTGCTRGIYMWDTPFVHGGKRVIVLDTEGIDDPNQDAEWATKLFILCLVLSSTLIYNVNGVVGSGDIGKLFLMRDLSRYIQPPQEDNYLPHLIILLRDFGLERPASLKEYFLDNLARINNKAAEGIETSFKEFGVYALPHPGIGGANLQQMQLVDTDSLESEFVQEATTCIMDIYRMLEPKYIGFYKMNGIAFSKFLVECIDKMNDVENNAHLSIPDEYEAVAYHVAQKVRDRCLELYRQAMEKLSELTPMSWEDFTTRHQAVFDNVIKEYVGSLIGTLEQIDRFKEKFRHEIDFTKQQYYERNSKELKRVNMEKARALWTRLIEPGLTVGRLFNEDGFRKALTDLEKQYTQCWIESPEAMEVLKYFKENRYKPAIDILTNFNVINRKLAYEMKEREKVHEQFLELSQREMKLKFSLMERDRQIQSIQETVDAKSEEIQQTAQKQAGTDSIIDRVKQENEKVVKALKAKYKKDMVKLREEVQEATHNKDKYLLEISAVLVSTLIGVLLL